MSGAVLVAVAAAVGNLLQGWDNATIAGAVLYIKREFNLESEPTIEGLIVAMSLIGATLITTCSGGISDWLGRRPMLIISSLLYFLSGLVMLWSPNVYVLLLGRLLDGFGIGLAVTLVPVYISETAPPEIRGLLNTLPQFTGSGGMFLSYCMVFSMSLMTSPSWRLMLGVLSIPSLIYFALTILFLPESPRWLVSKGRMLEAKQVLQRLRGREDVSGEMALLVEGLGVGGETTIEEYVIAPAGDLTADQDIATDKDQIKLYGPEEGLTWVARPVTGRSTLSLVSRHGSLANQSSLMDPLVTLFGSIHEKLPDTGGSMRSTLFPHFGSMFSVGGNQARNEEWDEESLAREGEDFQSDAGGGDSDDNLQSPLISRQTTSMEKDLGVAPQGSLVTMRQGSQMQGNTGEAVGSMGIGGGWQLAWKWAEREDQDGKKEGGFKRIYLHQEGVPGSRRGSMVSVAGDASAYGGELVQAAALVSQPALFLRELMSEHPVGPAMIHPSETAVKGPSWTDLFEPGVKHALLVGVGIQILQHYCRTLLLWTIPVLIASLLVLVIGSSIHLGNVLHAGISTVSVVLYFCFFVMGFGPIPNILCAEIFPTRVRGICIAICALTFWICDIIVTYTLPVMLKSVGLAGVFGMYAVVCVISWVFVYLKVPETKGMPLEVITEFFSVGAKQAAAAKNN
ncbi:monosaccharide-sensing protein 2 [Carica papaya]|uniref:monosaccharide-sensing protein 2 n=1 Tax=Carica papaya TaxID=3649 RepID=UPI000B8CC354|nr:monosaccharide-sensing protein 2 [Carica papaya]